MNAQQRHEHREFYNSLRLALIYPGESLAGVTKPYQPVDRYSLSWDELMQTPDTPAVARERRYETTMFALIGWAS